FFVLIPHPPTHTLFPYATLFRSKLVKSLFLRCPNVRTPQSVSNGLVLENFAAITEARRAPARSFDAAAPRRIRSRRPAQCVEERSEEHTSELQSRGHLVCRLLLE